LSPDGRFVTVLRTGQRALGARFGAVPGRWITDTATRLHVDRLGPRRIDYALVAKVDSAVHRSVKRELPTPPALEAWLDEHLIGRIPGSADAPGASDFLGRRATGPDGRDLGRIVDLVCEIAARGGRRCSPRSLSAGPSGRLLGYEREQACGPWIIETLAARSCAARGPRCRGHRSRGSGSCRSR
jgi:hypothetical protein